MDPRLATLQKKIASDGLAPVYAVCGDDELALKEAVTLLEAEAQRGGVDRDVFELGEHPLESALDAACTRPMWTPRRLVVLRCAKPPETEPLKALAAYAKSPAPFSTLVVVSRKLDARSAFAKAVSAAGGFVELSPPKAADLPGWLVGTAKEEGFVLDLGAARALVDAVGADPMALKTTLDKVIAYVGENRPIRVADVDAVVVRTREEVVWDLTNAIGARDLGKALATLHGMMEHGEAGLGAVGLAARHFRQLWRIKSLVASGYSGQDLATKAQVHTFVAQKLSEQARRVTDERLEEIVRHLVRADRALKSSRLSDQLIVERLIIELCRR